MLRETMILIRLNRHLQLCRKIQTSSITGMIPMKKDGCQIKFREFSAETTAHITDTGIHLDGRDLLHVETRNMCRCEKCFGKFAHQIQNLPPVGNSFPGIKVEEIGKLSEHYVSLKWSDGHEGLIARTVRGDFGPGKIEVGVRKWLDLTRRKNSEQEFWRTPNEEVKKFWDYSWVVSSNDNTREFLVHYMKYGIALINGVPTGIKMEDIISQGLKMGPLWASLYELVEYFTFKPDPTNLSYGSGALPLHMDLPYYYSPPHVQFFHCIENTVEGGDSYWADSFAAIMKMKEERPDLVEVLETVPMTYRYTPPGSGVFQLTHHPLIRTVEGDLWRTVDSRWSMDSAQFARERDLETRKKWWEAYSYYRDLIEDESSWFVKKLEGGEVVITDNWRVYHARKEFKMTADGQERILCTACMDWNSMANRVLSPEKGDFVFLEIDQH